MMSNENYAVVNADGLIVNIVVWDGETPWKSRVVT